MANTTIKPCTCSSEYQDKKYGKGQRVMNKGKGKDAKSPKFKCSVCGRIHE